MKLQPSLHLFLALCLLLPLCQAFTTCQFKGSSAFCRDLPSHVCCNLGEHALAYHLSPSQYYCVDSSFAALCEDIKGERPDKVASAPAEVTSSPSSSNGFKFSWKANSCYFDSALFAMFACFDGYAKELSTKKATSLYDPDAPRRLKELKKLVRDAKTNTLANNANRDSFRSELVATGRLSAGGQEDIRQMVELTLDQFSDQQITVYEIGRCVTFKHERFCAKNPPPTQVSGSKIDLWKILTAATCDDSNVRDYIFHDKPCEFSRFEDRIQTASGAIEGYKISPEDAEAYLNDNGLSLKEATADDISVPRLGSNIVLDMSREYRLISTHLPEVLPVQIQRQLNVNLMDREDLRDALILPSVQGLLASFDVNLKYWAKRLRAIQRLTIGRKYSLSVDLPQELDLSHVTIHPAGAEHPPSARYRLQSVVLHSGDWSTYSIQTRSLEYLHRGQKRTSKARHLSDVSNSGHYTAAARGCTSSNIWTYYDDMMSRESREFKSFSRLDRDLDIKNNVAFAFYVRE
eukprot:GILI01010033.1.p1 GENE.GILI01010033.1~~GILI01010033.1.p1  ORF type:complete len:519 (+),score=23.31 GILI01010033.1:84-1640(+)